ncbi:palmitoyltransferase ZDHHC6-like isoform X1 [Babylonia areolata]|uniref:palmitoyltransferase ZDHHC6-like isoform X1 n=1 Tax=Babylonia areolata TaxID=304850 RepID=UPI003FD62C69
MGHEVVGTWRQVFHWGPFLALSVIFTISTVTIKCAAMWWPPTHSLGGFLHLLAFLTWVLLTLFNYFMAMLKGPGFVPLGWKPKKLESTRLLQYCDFCKGYKAPRSHHCRKCDRCVMKMDHHCPWINTCCGHWNHANFCYFLFFAPCGCVHALFILLPSIYRAIHFQYYFYYRRSEPLVYLSVYGFVLTMFSIGLAIGVIIAVGMLFYIQMKSVLKNETGIESWIIDKALDRDRTEEEGEFIYPYHLGWRQNLRQVFTWSGRPKSNGFTWDIVDGCTQFTLTEEQIKQKAEKRDRTVLYNIMEGYSGRLFPCSKGIKVACCFPCTDEPRITLCPGDRVLVTRWKRHWLYGTKLLSAEEKQVKQRIRGWFPRRCAKEMMDDNENLSDKKDD